MGWTWDDLQGIPQPVYEELISLLTDEERRYAR